MHLLGTSVLAFLLLPLTLSCKSTKTKEKISDDYKHIISRQLEHIISNIESQLKKASMTCKAPRSPKTNSTQRIHSLACRIKKFINSQPDLEPELTNLVTHINGSLGCLCCSRQNKHPDCGPGTKTPKPNLCHLRKLLDKVKNAYEQFNSSP